MLVIEQRNYFKVNDKVHFFGPNNFSYDFVIQEMYNVDMQPVSVANHPKEIIKIKIDRPVPKNSFMRICFDNDTLTKWKKYSILLKVNTRRGDLNGFRQSNLFNKRGVWGN